MARFVSTYECNGCGRLQWRPPAYRRQISDVVIRLCAGCEKWMKREVG